MTIAGITKPGLIVMAILVAILWGCFIGERLTVQRANQEMARTLREMRRPTTPASLPQRSSIHARPGQSYLWFCRGYTTPMDPGIITLILFGGLVVVCLLGNSTVREWLKLRFAKSWPYAPATVESGDITAANVRGVPCYTLDVKYSFVVAGKKYTGTYSESFESEGGAKGMLESLQQFPPPARYKRGNPWLCAMDPHGDAALAYSQPKR